MPSSSPSAHPSPEEFSSEDQPRSKRSRQTDDAPPPRVELNPADCNLDFDISGNSLQGQALHEGGFAYCWSGARATVGMKGGKYCFGCKIISEQAVEMDDTPPHQQHLCRIGVSRGGDSVGNLGESNHSFGFGGTGKFSHEGKFTNYGTRFGVGDTIVCAVDLDSRPLATIGFSRNGQWLGIAKHFDATSKGLGVVDTPLRHLQWESALFPHALLKNVVVQMQFSREDGLVLVDGYEPWNSALADGNAILGPAFTEQRECEVLMMVGLPASGKTTWTEKWVKEHPEKQYVVLGTNLALDQMKVPGLLRKSNYGERFDRLMDRATVIFNTWLTRAAKVPRNYIIDQTNVYKNARIRKLKAFANYRKTAVVMFPSPSELRSRAEKRFKEMGKEVPAEAVNEMIANFVLPVSKNMPGSKEPFDEVLFPELSREGAQRTLDEMKCSLPRVLPASNDNFNNQHIGSPSPGTGSLRDSRTRSSFSVLQAPMNSSQERYRGIGPCGTAPYGRGLLPMDDMTCQQTHDARPWSVQSFQTPIGSQHQSHSSYTSTPPGDEHSIYTSYGSQSPYHPIPYNRELYERSPVPMGGMNLYRTHGSAEAYGRPGFETANSLGRSSHAHPSTLPAYSSQPIDPREPFPDNFSWSSTNYRPYGQDSYGVHNAGSQYPTPVPRPPLGAPRPNHMNPRHSPW